MWRGARGNGCGKASQGRVDHTLCLGAFSYDERGYFSLVEDTGARQCVTARKEEDPVIICCAALCEGGMCTCNIAWDDVNVQVRACASREEAHGMHHVVALGVKRGETLVAELREAAHDMVTKAKAKLVHRAVKVEQLLAR